MKDDFEYCEICNEVLVDEDDTYYGLCNECGTEEEIKNR